MHPAATILEGYEAGLRLFGENRVQEWQEKSVALSGLTSDARFHSDRPAAIE